jgi:hypothetical protein
MANNPNLIPTPIVDVTGKQTTVYRKYTSQPPSHQVMPPPTVTLSPEAKAHRDRFESALAHVHDAGMIDSKTAQGVAPNLKSNFYDLAMHSPDMLEEIVAHVIHAGEDEKMNLRWSLSRADYLKAAKKRGESDPVEFVNGMYRRLLALSPIVAPISVAKSPDSAQSIAQQLIMSVETSFNGNYGEDYSNLKAAVIVLGIKSLTMHENALLTMDESDRERIGILSKEIDSAVTVLPELIERKSTDPELVKLLASSSTSIMEGVL